MMFGLARLALAALALMLLGGPAAAQSEAQVKAMAEKAAEDANRDMQRAAENERAFDPPEWDGQGPPPIEMLIAQPSISHVAMSPDGRYVAASRREKGVSYLQLVNLETGAAGNKALRLDGLMIGGIQWGSNDRILYIAGAAKPRFEGNERGIVMVGGPRMYSVGLDLKAPILFFEKDRRLSRENFGATMLTQRIPGDARHILMPMRIQFELNLLKVDIYDGSWDIVGEGTKDTMAWFADRNGQPAIRIDRGNSRGTERAVMIPQKSASGKTTQWRRAQTVRFDRQTSNTPDFEPLAGGPSLKQYYIKARPAGGGTLGVYLYDIEKGQIVETVFSKQTADVDTALFDPDTGAFAGAFYWEDRLKFEFADPVLRAQMTALDDSFQRAWNVRPISRSTGDKRWLIHAGNAVSPGAYYIYDTEQKTASEIGLVQPALSRVRTGQVLSMVYSARDGMTISAYLTMPAGWTQAQPQPPMIVMLHGGPESRDRYEYNPQVQFFASRGYAVLQPNFRGSSGYGKAFQDAGLRHWGDAMQDDVADGVKFVTGLGLADPARVCIHGASYGGYSAMMSAVRHPDLYRCAAPAMGPSDLVKFLRSERQDEGPDSFAVTYWTAQLGDINRDREALEAASPALHADKIKIPMLLLHGKKDNTVEYEQSVFMRDAMQKAGKPVELVTFETGGHGFVGRDLKRYLGELEKFFGKHLGVEPVPMLPNPPP